MASGTKSDAILADLEDSLTLSALNTSWIPSHAAAVSQRDCETSTTTVSTSGRSGMKLGQPHVMLELLKEISVIGLRNAVTPSLSIWRRFIWIGLLVFGSVFTVYQVQDQYFYYLSWPTTVNINVEYPSELVFPTLKICNENFIFKSAAEKLNLTSALLKIYSPVGIVLSSQSYDPILDTVNWTQAYLALAQPKTPYQLPAKFRQSSTNLTLSVPTDMGYCFEFNSDGNNGLVSQEPGATQGFLVALMVASNDYLIANSLGSGYRILIHPYNEYAFVADRGLSVAAGMLTKVAIEPSYIIDAPAPYSNCKNDANYIKSHCEINCLAAYVIETCKCKDIFMPGSAPVCGLKDRANCSIVTVKKFKTENMQAKRCNCPRQCQVLDYTYSVSVSDISDLAVDWITKQNNLTNNGSKLDFKKNMAILEVFFPSLKQTHIESTPTFTFLTFLCNVGGALGLVLGSSLLTVCELVDLAVIVFLREIAERRSRSLKLGTVQSH